MRPLTCATLLSISALFGATGAHAQDAGEPENGIDWSVGLRGSYAANSLTGGKPSLSLTPEASVTLEGQSSTTTYGVGGELILDAAGQGRVADVHAGVTTGMRLGATTALAGSLSGALTQDDPGGSGLPANTLTAPLVFDGAAMGSVTQDMGRVDATLTVEGARRMVGTTTLDDLSLVDNTHKSFWQGGAILRLGYEVTPLLSAFIEGETSVQKFDAADPVLLSFADGQEYQLRAGLSFTHGTVISAEASVGRGWLDYADGARTDTQAWVYNGSVTFRPDETLSLNAALETSLDPSTSVAGDTDASMTLTATARYQVNPWLTLRSSAGWERTVTLGTGDESWGLDAGAGLDYRSSRYVTWTADYAYARDHAPPTPVNDTHTVSVGVRVGR